MKDIASSQTTLLVLISSPCPPHSTFAFPNPSLVICTPVGFFIVSEMYCLKGSPDLYVSTTSWGVVELSNGFDCIAPKAVVAKPRTRMIAVITRVANVFFLDIISDNSKPRSQVAPQFPHLAYGIVLKSELILLTHLYYIY